MGSGLCVMFSKSKVGYSIRIALNNRSAVQGIVRNCIVKASLPRSLFFYSS